MIGEERKHLIWENGSNTNLIEIIGIVDSLTLQLIYSISHISDIIFGTKDSNNGICCVGCVQQQGKRDHDHVLINPGQTARAVGIYTSIST